MMPEVKQAVQGVFNHNYWLMVNDFGDTLELSCEDYEQGHFGCADKCERWEYNSWSNCVMRIRFRDKNFKINGASNFIYVESFRDEITVDKMSLPGAWRSQWLPNKRRLSDSVRMDLGINVIVSNFTDYHGDRYDDVFLSGPFVGPSFGFSFFYC